MYKLKFIPFTKKAFFQSDSSYFEKMQMTLLHKVKKDLT